MTIRNEKYASDDLLFDSLYHRSSLNSHPRTAFMVPDVQKAEKDLEAARDNRRASENVRTDALAVLNRNDFEYDQVVRNVNADVFAAVKRDRKDPAYLACFPDGVEPIVDLRGKEQVLAVGRMQKALAKGFPKIAQENQAALDQLGRDCLASEAAWKDAESAATEAEKAELAAKRLLILRLQKDEGELLKVFPGQKARVRSFFRHRSRAKDAKKAHPSDGKPPAPEPPAKGEEKPKGEDNAKK